MRAVICSQYGGPEVLNIQTVAVPTPKPDEVLVRVHATTVTSADRRIRAFDVPRGLRFAGRLAMGWSGPRQPILGTELAGIVIAVGPAVSRFAIGDAVMAFPGGKLGGHAEYRALPETGLIVPKPANLSFAEAASIPFGACTAQHFLKQSRLQAGDRVLVVGASGGVGSALLQLAKAAGAKITAVTSSRNSALVQGLGADHVIAYDRTDYLSGSDRFDIVFDTVGSADYARSARLLLPGGRFAAINGGLGDMLKSAWPFLGEGKRVLAGPAGETLDFLQQAAALAHSGTLKPLIDRSFDFANIAAAHAYVDTGRKRGSVVIDFGLGQAAG